MTDNSYQDPYSSQNPGGGSGASHSANQTNPQQLPQHTQGQQGYQQPSYQPGFQQQGYQQQGGAQYPMYQASKPTSQAAVWALVVGLGGWLLCGLPYFVGVFLGWKGMQDTKPDQPYSGNGIAIAGFVLNILGILVFILNVVLGGFTFLLSLLPLLLLPTGT